MAPEAPRSRGLRLLCGLGAAGLLLLGLFHVYLRVTHRVPFLAAADGSFSVALYVGRDLTSLAPKPGVPLPALVARDAHDAPRAAALADPFLLRRGDTWYLFFEVLSVRPLHGSIGVATSADGGGTWSYQGIVLEEAHHLSYPHVFEWKGQVYMVPETNDLGRVTLYRAEAFPGGWRPDTVLVEGRRLVDPTPFHHEGHWYMFASAPEDRVLHLLESPALRGPWREHPASPVVSGDPARARPAGRVVGRDGVPLRLAQDCSQGYGSSVRAFRILELTPARYREEALVAAPILSAGGADWNRLGMHQLDAHQLEDGTWLACVDGRGSYRRVSLRYWR